MSRTSRRVLALVAGLVTAVLLAGCQGAYDLPLPGGGAGHGGTFEVTAEFADVLDLVPQSAVKVDDVTVGQVEKVTLDGWNAKVLLKVKDSVALPDNATAEIAQTSLLGEKYVALARPTGTTTAVGRLSDGDVLPLSRTSQAPEVEEVLGALSLLLNGGGVGQLKVIEAELNKALGGHEADVRQLLGRLDTTVRSLDAQKQEIVRAIDAIDALSSRLAAQRGQLADALDTLPGGLEVLADQREQLTALLTSLRDLGTVGSHVIRASKADTVANLKSLQPILTQLDKAGDALPNSLELLLTYPFPDDALDGVKGDYTNLWISADLDTRSLVDLGRGTLGGSGSPSLPGLPHPTVPTLPTLPTLPLPSVTLPVPTTTCTLAGGVEVPLPGTSCPSLPTAPTKTVTCVSDLTGTVFTWPGTTCPATSHRKPAGSSSPSPSSSTGGGGVCVPGVICLGAAEPEGYDPNLAGLMLSGVASPGGGA